MRSARARRAARQRAADWYRKNRKRAAASAAARYQANPGAAKRKAEQWRRRHYRRWLFMARRRQARAAGIPFTIEFEDMIWPEWCPVLGLRLQYRLGRGRNRPDAPSLDRVRPALGYVPGNVAVISARANTVKRDASADEIRQLLYWMEKQGL
jgi:hypothetical protein